MTAVAPAPKALPSMEPTTPPTPKQRPTLLSLAMKRRQALEEANPLDLIRERILMQRQQTTESENHTPMSPNTPKTPQTPQVASENPPPTSPSPAPEPAEKMAEEPGNEENLIDM
ncbi:hypothetical protein SprV_0301127500 [Sparganum proliferum]